MRLLTKLYYRLFPTYRTLENKVLNYTEADKLIRQNEGKPPHEQWVLSPMEDMNRGINIVFLERRERIIG